MHASIPSKRINNSNAKALRRTREMFKLSRKELALLLKLSPKAIEKYENGRAILNQEKISWILQAYNISWDDFLKIKKGKSINSKKKERKVIRNKERRSYQKVITKEVQVLKFLRNQRKISQDQASFLCGYSRPTIGHIENGRIELSKSRINHILKFYEYSREYFDELCKEIFSREEVLNECYEKILTFSTDKLKLIQALLQNM